MGLERTQSDVIVALHRDVRWLERKLREIRDAKAASADRLRELAAHTVETAKQRSKKTLSM